ncbi:MAG: hypothetical protein MK211_10670 [Flavobacteriales bacterium]|jgi:hypothetical protein|uniref:hypothetical protein n=1 Tax=Candidatus Ulvibacter alkanivorans TaxID=2267620 RepID=UPI000DF45D78|nr:hypothetical protein [Candidatus Ulvibacter alkanivorans]MCH2490599.1 hypothetical protein [Flavobacteriales bacterium]
MKTNLTIPVLGVLSFLLTVACVKDTDFDQAEEVLLTPVVELDLIYFNLEAEEFYDEATNSEILTVTDTTEIRFLDDTEIQESLVKAEFFFRFTNSIPRDFTVDFDFLSEQGELTYSTGTNVSSGDTQDPVITEFTETVEGDEITQLTMADRVVVSVTIPSSNASLQGALNLKSKTTYFLEITDRE